MKRILNILIALFAVTLSVAAQDSIARPQLTRDILDEAARDSAATRLVTLPLGRSAWSQLDMMPGYGYYAPWAPVGPMAWSLHEGMNVEVGFSVSAGLGKHRPKGVGFGEHLAAAYAMPLSQDRRWVGAIGLYADRLDWGAYQRTEAGIAGLLGYNVNDWCSLYLYGAYNFMNDARGGCNPYAFRFSPYCSPYGTPYGYGLHGCYDPYDHLRARIGAAAAFKVGEHATLSVSFEHDIYDSPAMGPVPVVPPPTGSAHDVPFGHPSGHNSAGQGGNGRR